MVNLLPLGEGELITKVLPLPEDEAEWDALHIMFATAQGMVRRNSMAAFTNVPSNGKYAMGFVEGSGDRLIGVRLLTEDQDVFLASDASKAIRFAAADARETKSRTGIGVRGMTMEGETEVVSMAVLEGNERDVEQREAYLKAAPWKQGNNLDELDDDQKAMAEKEEFILTLTANGYGKISSAYEYRTIGRGGKGLVNIGSPESDPERNGPVVASFPVTHGDQIMLVTDQAKLIRLPVEFRHLIEGGFEDHKGLPIIGRTASGVRIFNVADGEKVVSVARIDESEMVEDESEDESDEAPEA